MKLYELCRLLQPLLLLAQNTNYTDIEFKFSIKKLNKLLADNMLDVEATVENLAPFRDFLALRLRLIIGMDVIYPHARNCPLNNVCIEIAKKIAPYFKKSYLQLLMPSVEVLTNDVTGTRFVETLKLHEFVLSDDNKRFIEVEPCLSCAREDGILKHTSLFNGAVVGLNKEEGDLVSNHSVQAKNYYTSIIKLVKARNDGKSVGAMVKQLMDSLRQGGAHGREDGAELNAGQAANVGILVFSEYLNTLNPDIKERLFNCRGAERGSKTFKELWERLARPDDANFRSVIYCVEIISNGLDDILKSNSWLYNTYNSGQIIHEPIEQLEARCDRAQREFDAAFNSESYRLTVSYGDKEKQNRTLIRNFCVALQWYDFIAAVGRDVVRHYFTDYKLIGDVLKNLPDGAQLEFINYIIMTYGLDYIGTVINSSDKLGFILDRFPPAQCFTILTLFDNNVTNIIDSVDELGYILLRVPDDKCVPYLGLIKNKLKKMTLDGISLALILEIIPVAEWGTFINIVFAPKEQEKFMLDPSISLVILERISKEKLQNFIEFLAARFGQDFLTRVVKDINSLSNLLKRLSAEVQPRLLRIIKPYLSNYIKALSDLTCLMTQLSEDNKIVLIKLLSPNLLLKLVDDVHALVRLLTPIQLNNRLDIIKLFKPEYLAKIINSIDVLLLVLASLEEKDKLPLLEYLGQEYLYLHCWDTALFGKLIAHFPVNMRAGLLQKFAAEKLKILISTPKQLEKVLSQLKEAERFAFITMLDETQLVNLAGIFYSPTNQTNGFYLINTIVSGERLEFGKLFKRLVPVELHTLLGCNSTLQLGEKLICTIDKPQRYKFVVEVIGINAIRTFVRTIDDLTIFFKDCIPSDDKYSALVDFLGMNTVELMLNNGKDLMALLCLIPCSDWADVLISIADARFQVIFPDRDSLINLMRDLWKKYDFIRVEFRRDLLTRLVCVLMRDSASVIDLIKGLTEAESTRLINTVGIKHFLFDYSDFNQLEQILRYIPKQFRKDVVASLRRERIQEIARNSSMHAHNIVVMLPDRRTQQVTTITDSIPLFANIIVYLEEKECEIFLKLFACEQLQALISTSDNFYRIISAIKSPARNYMPGVIPELNSNKIRIFVAAFNNAWLCNTVVQNITGLIKFISECGQDRISQLSQQSVAAMVLNNDNFQRLLQAVPNNIPADYFINVINHLSPEVLRSINLNISQIYATVQKLSNQSQTTFLNKLDGQSLCQQILSSNFILDQRMPDNFITLLLERIQTQHLRAFVTNKQQLAAMMMKFPISMWSTFLAKLGNDHLQALIGTQTNFYTIIALIKASGGLNFIAADMSNKIHIFISAFNNVWLCNTVVQNIGGLIKFIRDCGQDRLSLLSHQSIAAMVLNIDGFQCLLEAVPNNIPVDYFTNVINHLSPEMLKSFKLNNSQVYGTLQKLSDQSRSTFLNKLDSQSLCQQILTSDFIHAERIPANFITLLLERIQSQDLRTFVSNKQQLAAMMMKFPKSMWSTFITKLGNDFLCDIFITGNTFEDAVIALDEFRNNNNEYKALLFCAYEFYGICRDREIYEYTSFWGQLFGHSKALKLAAKTAGQNAIVNDLHLNAAALRDHRSALTSGELSLISKRQFRL